MANKCKMVIPTGSDLQSFGTRLRTVMESEDIRMCDLARQLGVTAQAASRWWRSENYPSVDNIILICEYLQVNMDWLCRGRGAVYSYDKRCKKEVKR